MFVALAIVLAAVFVRLGFWQLDRLKQRRARNTIVASRIAGAPRPIDEAISSAGGVRFEAMDAASMLRALPGVFCAGEMLDWEAPTGGYLLSACLASGKVAGHGVVDWLAWH